MEIGNLSAAMEDYQRTVHGLEYPPNFGDDEVVLHHLQMKFGKYDPEQDGITRPPADLDAAEALVFWLGGFGPDPRDPLADGQRQKLFAFDETRLRDADGDGWPEYYPRNDELPYVYIRHDSYSTVTYSSPEDSGTAQAYRTDTPNTEFVNPQSYQIIAAGLDDHYGSGGKFPSGEGYSRYDRDNVTNFSEGTLGSNIP